MSWGMGPAVIRSTDADNSFAGACRAYGGTLVSQGSWVGQCSQDELQGGLVSLGAAGALMAQIPDELMGACAPCAPKPSWKYKCMCSRVGGVKGVFSQGGEGYTGFVGFK